MARKPMTDEQKAAWAEKMKAARAAKQTGNVRGGTPTTVRTEPAPDPEAPREVKISDDVYGNTDLSDIDAQIEMLQKLKMEKSMVDPDDFAARLKIRFPQLNFYYDEKDYQFQNARGEQTTVRRYRITVTRMVEHTERHPDGTEETYPVEIIIGQNTFTDRDFALFQRFAEEVVNPPKKIEGTKIQTVQGKRVFNPAANLQGVNSHNSGQIAGWKEESVTVESTTVPIDRSVK